MSFKYSTDPKDWQTSYTEKQAFEDSRQRGDSLQMPILMIPILFSFLYLAPPLINAITEGVNQSNLISMAVGGIIFILPIILYIAIRGHLLKNAGTFLKTFYDLPDSVNIKELVDLRVNGRSPMPPPLSAWMKFPTIKVKNGQLDVQENWQTTIGGPVKLKIEPGNAIYLERGNRFSRVVGQGEAFLELHETIKTVLNTGPQSEDISVTAWTRDGIRIGIQANGEYFLGTTAKNEGKENELYPFDPDATRKAVEEALSSGREGYEWSKIAMGKTAGLLGEYISNRYLEEIFIANGGQFLSTNTTNDLLANINSRLQKFGIGLSRLHIKDVELPEQVNTQMIKLWETGHKTFQTITESEVKAYQLRSQKKALAEMVRDMVFTLANGLERMDATNLTEKLLSSIYEVINQGMKDPRTYLSSPSKKMPDGVESFTLENNSGEEETEE